MMNVLKMIEVKGVKRIVLALVICVLCAMLDEFHQLFVPGRAAQVKDVIIDSIGAIAGIGIKFPLGTHSETL